jgi:hypothetical protein
MMLTWIYSMPSPPSPLGTVKFPTFGALLKSMGKTLKKEVES